MMTGKLARTAVILAAIFGLLTGAAVTAGADTATRDQSASPASVLAGSTSFYVSYGNTATKGEVDWYVTSVIVQGSIKSATDTRRTYVVVYNADGGVIGQREVGRDTVGGTGTSFNTTINTQPYPPAYAWVYLELTDGTVLGKDLCVRGDIYCS